ncbi:hypothetical protein Aperf_G00000086759 [Anoplocephala perfoliata]
METLTTDVLDASHVAQASSVHSVSSSSATYAYFASFLSRVIHPYHHRNSGSRSDGFIHVTVDRLLFVAFSSGHKPALLASWNFTNGEINVFGTGRISATTPGDHESKIFYLMDASGRFVFACEKAAELSAWIQRATRPAFYLYERRWLSSVAAQLGENQALLLLPLHGVGIGRKPVEASLSDISELHCFDLPLSSSRKFQTSMYFGGMSVSSTSIINYFLSTLIMDSKTAAPVPQWAKSCLVHADVCSVLCCTVRVSAGPTGTGRKRFLSHPTDKPVLSIGHLQTGRQHDGCILRHCYSNLSAIHNTPLCIQCQAFSTEENYRARCNSLTSTMADSTAELTDEGHAAMVALSPLPLDYLPGASALPTKEPKSPENEAVELEVDVEVHNPAVASDATTSSSLASGKASSSPPAPQSIPPPPPPPPPAPPTSGSTAYRATRSRLPNSWSTSITNFSPGLFSFASPSTQGARTSITGARAASECRNCNTAGIASSSNSAGREQLRWSRTRQRQDSRVVLGVTCSVPWDAAATGEKPRTGRLYSSREEIREAALKAAAVVVAAPPLSSLPSGEPSPLPSPSPSDDQGEHDASAGQCSQAAADVAHSSKPTPFSPTQASASALSFVSPYALQCYVNLGPHSPISTSAASIMSSSTSSATMITSATSSSHSATATTTNNSNYLSYSPYMPLSRQRAADSGHWRGHCRNRIRTLSSGQPPIGRWLYPSTLAHCLVILPSTTGSVGVYFGYLGDSPRNPLMLLRQTTYDGSQHLPSPISPGLSQLRVSSSQTGLTTISSSTDPSDTIKLAGLQSQGLHESHEEAEEEEEAAVAVEVAEPPPPLSALRQSDPLHETSSPPSGGGDESGNDSGASPNYVVIDFSESNQRALSQIMRHVTATAEFVGVLHSGDHNTSVPLPSENRLQRRLSAEHNLRRLCSFLLSHRMLPPSRRAVNVEAGRQRHQTLCSRDSTLIAAEDLPSSPSRSILFWWLKRRRSGYALRNSR